MSVGRTITKQGLDGELADAVITLVNTLDRLRRIKLAVDRLDQAALEALGYNEATAGDVTLLRSVLTDLDLYARIFPGEAAQAGATNYDFRTFAGRITGTG